MIKASGIQEAGQPYLTRIEDENGKNIIINSSRMKSEYLSCRQMVMAGLAGCMSMTMKGELFRNHVSYRDVIVEVDLVEVDEEHTEFTYKMTVDSDEDPEVIQKIKETAVANCYVKGILTSNITTREIE